MNIIMDYLPTGNIDQIEEFLKSNGSIKMEITSIKDKYEFIREVLIKTHYSKIRKKEKNIVLCYLKFLTKYSQGHLKHLVKKWRKGLLHFNPSRKRNKFQAKYLAADVARLIETDIVHNCLNGKATKEILRREADIFCKKEYGNISNLVL